jgi:hypothetical protein
VPRVRAGNRPSGHCDYVHVRAQSFRLERLHLAEAALLGRSFERRKSPTSGRFERSALSFASGQSAALTDDRFREAEKAA